MQFTRIKPWLGTLVRLVLGVVWMWASLSKLKSPGHFLLTVRAYDATPEWLSKAIAYGLPVLELCLGVVLIVGIVVRIAAAVSAALLVVFLIGLIQAAARGIKLDCGCFGGGGTTGGSTSYTLDILRDIVVLALAAYLVVWSFTRLSLEEFLGRHDHVELPSAKRMRTEQGRRKYESQVALAQREARSRTLYVTGSLALVVFLVVLIGISVQSNRAKITVNIPAKNASTSTGVVYGKKAAATVDVYEDFGCPVCLQFEQQSHAELDKQVKANLVQLRFHPIAILDGDSPNRYSTRAANAALCASDVSVDAFVAYHNLLYGSYKSKQVQPSEGTAGPTDPELVTLAQAAKLTPTQVTTFTTCLSDKTYYPVVGAMTDAASKKGISSTPTILVNGKKLGTHDLASIEKAIKAADAKGPAPSPSPTASPSASGSGAASGSASSSGSSAVAPASSSAVPKTTASSTVPKTTASSSG